jgi:hypothetical protein
VHGHSGEEPGGGVPRFFFAGDQCVDRCIEFAPPGPKLACDECLCCPTDSGRRIASLDFAKGASPGHPLSVLGGLV